MQVDRETLVIPLEEEELMIRLIFSEQCFLVLEAMVVDLEFLTKQPKQLLIEMSK